MANRRMISAELMRSDEFLSLPNQSQLLYIHLLVEADDDGFLQGKKRIMAMLGMKPAVLHKLTEAGFLIEFPSGATVITHWKLFNQIKKDRYTPTKHRAEMAQLTFTPEAGYVLQAQPQEVPEAASPAASEIAPTATVAGESAQTETAAPQEAASGAPRACPYAAPLPLADGSEYVALQKEADEWRRLYPGVDLPQELRNMRGWLLSHPEKRKTAENIGRFINTWLANAQKSGSASGRGEGDSPPSYDIDLAEHRRNTVMPKLRKKQR